jgi:hypothetical protein
MPNPVELLEDVEVEETVAIFGFGSPSCKIKGQQEPEL